MACKGFIGILEDGSVVYHDGDNVFRAAKGNVPDVRTGYLQGRWECSVLEWNRFRHSLFDLPKVSV